MKNGFCQRKSAEHVVFDILRNQEDVYTLQKGTAREVTAALRNSNNSNGLFVVKLALFGNKDASATVEWMLNVLYPGNIPSDNIDSIVRQEQDIEIMKDPRYVEIFKMVDYSICGIEVDDEKPYSKTLVVRKNVQGKLFNSEELSYQTMIESLRGKEKLLIFQDCE